MKRVLAFSLILIVGLWPAAAQAQAPDPEVIAGTVAISSEQRAAIESFVADTPPSTAIYYAPTYAQDKGAYALISLAGLNIAAPTDPWSLEARGDEAPTVIWIGTVRVYADGSVELRSKPQQAAALPKLAAPIAGPGGGTYVRLPFDPGRSMMYGVRLLHGSGDYGTSGMLAVDLVGGDSLGTNVASSTVYASAAGEVEYVCVDDHSAAIRTYNAAADDYFVYAHLIDNASLVLETTFYGGQTIGVLRYGAFDDTCGWAEQGDDIYHIHWMFEPAGGSYKVGTYTITTSDEKFHSGDKTYGHGDFIFNNLVHEGDDDSGAAGSHVPSIWDNIVAGIVSFAVGTGESLPPHGSSAMSVVNGARNTIVLTFRMVWLLLRDSFYLAPVAYMLGMMIALKLILWTIYLIFWVIRTIRQIKQTVAF